RRRPADLGAAAARPHEEELRVEGEVLPHRGRRQGDHVGRSCDRRGPVPRAARLTAWPKRGGGPMLSEAGPFSLVNGMTFLGDPERRDVMYFQPLVPRFITERDGDLDVPKVSLIIYRSAQRSGGLLDFDVSLEPDKDQLEDAAAQLKRLAG